MTDPALDLTLTFRMVCAQPDNPDDRTRRACPFVRLLDGAAARGLADNRAALEARVAALQLGPVVWFDTAGGADAVRRGVAQCRTAAGSLPAVAGVPGVGLLVRQDTPQALAGACRALEQQGAMPAAGGGAAAAGGRLRGCVAIVTGSAQGFGKGIAEALVREGAGMLVADLNSAAGEAFAADLNRRYGDGAALFARMDVTSSASIAEGVARCVRHFGGIDLLVANAGVLKAGGLDDMGEADFDLVTAVNYKAFFLCAKAVASWMRRQHAVNPHHFMDIVQINSKSGLEGSRRNFAYAGSKFGAIGLTQSFALELVGDGIKVNAVCPGNYFEGPLWSDPEQGLFVQYLRAGKVPGARTLEDVRAFYLEKVPMRRGCAPDDVATAIFYLHDQTYETGQALPVTGGQVMLN
jgi:NAD(P)-dependent dehydrogenase (short-subunit alcohol dehydrogenase family)